MELARGPGIVAVHEAATGRWCACKRGHVRRRRRCPLFCSIHVNAIHVTAAARVVEGTITRIVWFISGGAILRLKDSVRGTATAASLWATGAVGHGGRLGSL